MKFTYLQNGLIKESINKLVKTTLFSLDAWINKILAQYNIAYNDPCCPTDIHPVSYDEGSETLNYHNGTTQVNIPLTAPCFTFYIENILEETIEVDYIDCDGVLQTQTLNSLNNATVCAKYVGLITTDYTVTNLGACL
jgi:hypothetical protein